MALEFPLSRCDIASLTDNGSFARGVGYHKDGRVEMRSTSSRIARAVVRGTTPYEVELRLAGDSVDSSCSCPMGERMVFCKHCVAVALALIPDGDQPRKRPHRKRAAAPGTAMSSGEIASWKKRIREAFSAYGSWVDWKTAPRWANHADRVIDDLDRLVETAPSEDVVRLLEFAHDEVERALQYIDDSDGHIGPMSDRLLALHVIACEDGQVDPIALAHRLVEIELTSDISAFHQAALSHAIALGDDGLAEYRRVIKPRWQTRDPEDRWASLAVTEAMAGLALACADPDELIRIRSREEIHASEADEIARALLAAGRADEAIDWAQRGLARAGHHPVYSQQIRDFLADMLRNKNNDAAAEELYWQAFSSHPSVGIYRQLIAETAAADTGQQALGWLFERVAQSPRSARWWETPATPLIEILLHEGDIDEAWKIASEHGCRDEMWLTLARAREKTHPQESVPVYRDAALREIATVKRAGYEQAIRYLRRIQRLADSDQFTAIIAAIRDEHARKPTLMRLLDKAGW